MLKGLEARGCVRSPFSTWGVLKGAEGAGGKGLCPQPLQHLGGAEGAEGAEAYFAKHKTLFMGNHEKLFEAYFAQHKKLFMGNHEKPPNAFLEKSRKVFQFIKLGGPTVYNFITLAAWDSSSLGLPSQKTFSSLLFSLPSPPLPPFLLLLASVGI